MIVGQEFYKHVGTGLFLDSDIKHIYIAKFEAPWEGNHTPCYVKPWSGEDSQKWKYQDNLLKHKSDGRALDINWWKLEPDQDMGVNIPHSDCRGQKLVFMNS